MADNKNEEVVVETEAVTKANDQSVEKAEKKPGFFKRAWDRIKKFWKSYKSEIKKVTIPLPREETSRAATLPPR